MSENILLEKIEKVLKRFSSFEDSYEIQKLLEKEQNKENVFGFWSPFDGVGKTTTVVNIAHELAKKGNKVCVVDLNLLLPDVFRYLKPDMETNKNGTVKSIREKLINPTSPITEFVVKSKYNNISLLTSLFTEHPSIYCSQGNMIETQEKREIDIYVSMFKELAEIYDYVLLDLDTTIIETSTIAAFRSCDNIITFIGHYPKSVEYTMKTVKVFNELGLFGVFDNVIQGPVYVESWTQQELRIFNPNLNLIATMPHSNEVNTCGNNLDLFMAFNKSANKTAVMFKNSIIKITATLEQLVKQSIEKNKEERKVAAKNAKIVMGGLSNYIHDNPELAESDFLVGDEFLTGILEVIPESMIEENAELILDGEVVILEGDELFSSEIITDEMIEEDVIVENAESIENKESMENTENKIDIKDENKEEN